MGEGWRRWVVSGLEVGTRRWRKGGGQEGTHEGGAKGCSLGRRRAGAGAVWLRGRISVGTRGRSYEAGGSWQSWGSGSLGLVG